MKKSNIKIISNMEKKITNNKINSNRLQRCLADSLFPQ